MAKRRKRVKKQGKFLSWLKNLSLPKKILLAVVVIILVVLVALVIYVANIFGKMETEEIKEEEILVNELDEEVGVGYTNFAIFGSDSREGDVSKDLNTDTIIIVNLNNETKEIRLISVYRDTLLDMSNGKIQKANAAYSIGGAKQAISMLNMNFDLDIQKYVTVDFTAVVDLIDLLGGIEVDVSEAEMNAVNDYIWETAGVSNKAANVITEPGLQLLDGVQATTYARIRKGVGDDYGRTERQRLVIQNIAEKAVQSGWSTINSIIDELFPRISTNFTMTEILKYAKSFTKYTFGENTGFPYDLGSDTLPGLGSCLYPLTLESNVQQLHEFLYGTVDYQPSYTVQNISDEIAYLVSSYGLNDNPTSTNTSESSTWDDTESDSDTWNSSGSGTGGTDTGSSTGGTGTGSGTGGTGTGSSTGGTGTGSSTGGTGTGGNGTGGTGTGSGTGTGTGSGTDGTGTGSGTGTGTGSGTGTGTGSGTGGTDTGSDTDSTTGSDNSISIDTPATQTVE